VIAAQSLEALSGLQKADADRKRDAFMDHLKSKYPQHALALRGQQDRMREQVSGSSPWAGCCGQGRHLSQSGEWGVGELALPRAVVLVILFWSLGVGLWSWNLEHGVEQRLFGQKGRKVCLESKGVAGRKGRDSFGD
jgi:hypothetical protein